jgi:hypothetical protein
MTRARTFPCPNCKSSEIRRSHRKNNFERLISFAIVPCRCQMCDGRFFRLRWMMPKAAAAPQNDKAHAAQS